MTGPQLFVLFTMAISTIAKMYLAAIDDEVSSGWVAVYVVLIIAWQVLFGYVLHVGGFW